MTGCALAGGVDLAHAANATVLPALSPLPRTVVTGIRNSEHDLSSTSGAALRSSTEGQICKYCHTPHRAQSTHFLWNRSPTAATTWQWGVDLDGNTVRATSVGTLLPVSLRAASKRCLACHDGSTAIGDVSNAGDGSPGVIAGLTAVGAITSPDGRLIDGAKLVGGPVVGTIGSLAGSHPVSIPYAGQTGYNGLTSNVPAAAMAGATGGYFDPTTSGCVSPTGACTTAPAGDGRNGAAINLVPNVAGGLTNFGIECSTCHEPHNQSGFAWFTRVDVENASGLCRSCHNK